MIDIGGCLAMDYDQRIMPVEEILHEDEFTGRVEILRELEEWIEQIGRVGAGSISIIAPRRMGKTVLLDRLVNEVFFKVDYKVAPIYYKMKREEITLRKFLLEYATTFFRQYIAYCLQDPVMYRRTDIRLKDLLNIQSEKKPINIARDFINGFLRRYNDGGYEDARNHWDNFIKVPEDIASFSGTRAAIIIDEFQDMKFFVYDTDENHLEEISRRNDTGPGYGAIDLTATYDRQALSKKAPMLVSGSAVSLIFRTVMGGPLGGRFGFKYLKPLSFTDGATLITKLTKIYINTNINPENALYASTEVGGHPFYLYCLVVSDYQNKSFDTPGDIDNVIRYEIEKGKIYGFWQTHFENNKDFINSDHDSELGKKIIYYFTKYNDKPVEIEEMAKKLKVSKEAVKEKLEKLYLADLVYRTEGRYYGFNDICLMRFIQFVYAKDLEGLEEIDLSERGKYNNLKGRFLELVVENVMRKFDGEEIDGRLMGKENQVMAPIFQVVDSKFVKGENTDSYQIDVYGKVHNERKVWLCECKYRNSRMSMTEIRKLEKAVFAYKKELEQEGAKAPEIIIWLISTGGFTREVRDYVQGQGNIYLSDYDAINHIFRQYGSGYDIPMFNS
jgi:hypothetical protein